MHLSDFEYTLPPSYIALKPAMPRESAKLLVYHRAKNKVEHARVGDLPKLLPAHTLCLANNSAVRACRLPCSRRGKLGELLLLSLDEASHQATCLIRNHRALVGSKFEIPGGEATILMTVPHAAMTTVVVHFSVLGSLESYMHKYGEVPLPPYITQRRSESATIEEYQPNHASIPGSAAAPTAGLHITQNLRTELVARGHGWSELTLHVGLGTFLPLRHRELTSNILHSEWYSLPPITLAELNQDNTVLCIGTTSLRALESFYQNKEPVGETNLFLYPGKTFRRANHLLTNFHLPKSSLMALVAAFLCVNQDGEVVHAEQYGVSTIQTLYQAAIKHQYRFYSFGDAMLIL
jgi:S-adenosylmethionine:tRNA ribosyltransferase-isomerase